MIGWEFAGEKSITWEGRSCNGFPTERLSRGVFIYGTDGSALLEGNNYTVFDKKNKQVKELTEAPEGAGTDTRSANGIRLDRMHVKNFIDAIVNGGPLNSPIEEGHKSVAMLHLGNIAQRVGRTLACSASDGHILHDDEAMKLWGRAYEPGWEPAA